MKLRNLIKIIGLASFFLAAPVGADIKLVAKVDQTAAGFPSHFSYKNLQEPVIGPSGHVAFAGLAFDGRAYTKAAWAGLPGDLEAIIKENDTIAGFPGNVFFSDVSSSFLISRSGAVAFSATLKGAITRNTALVYRNGVTQGILKATDQAPGFPPGTVVGEVTPLAISDAGVVLGGMTTAGAALWFWDFEKIERISTTIGDCNYFSLAVYVPGSVGINQTGNVVFNATLYSGDKKKCFSGGVFKWSNGKTELLVADGDPVPGMPDAVFGVSLTESPPKINDQDEIIFTAKLIQIISSRSTNNSIWIKNGLNEPRLLLLGGEGLKEKSDNLIFPAIFLDSNFANFGYSMLPVIANGLDVLLAGKPREIQPYDDPKGTGATQLTTIAAKNDQPPGFDPSWYYNIFSNRAINNAEQYVFTGYSANALERRNVFAMWRGTGTERPRLIAQDGMKCSINNVEYILRDIDLFPTKAVTLSTAGGQSSWFSDTGEIVFRASLNSSSNVAILLITDDSKEQRIFSLAEQLFPEQFSPSNVDNQLLEGFVYRYYPATKTYIGIKNGEVFVLGDAFGSSPQRIDTIDNTLQFLESLTGS
ncbi:hypothetical protein R2103_01030 [Nitrosomonas sp. Is24]|uniref:DUF7453 family protein n=1 Tax=Nitrosomonas sp. Is24 TaxID=3080533 RepID=UPI00294AD7E7|nr:hypothetical protein [Nitrosomonas sp. Is24]MDV6340355.1 hypothetical protein [Nitrosomonas sp. Is24]